MKKNKLNKEEISKRNDTYYYKNRELIHIKAKENYNINKKTINEKAKKYYLKNREKCLNDVKAYAEKIKLDPIKSKEAKERKNIYLKKYRQKNPHIHTLRNHIKNIKEKIGTIKEKSLIEELGYSSLDFKQHISSLFTKGMAWDNIGIGKNKWNVDHKIPITWFKQNTPFNIINNLNNLHPIWWELNIQKGNHYSHEIPKDYYELIFPYVKDELINEIICGYIKIKK